MGDPTLTDETPSVVRSEPNQAGGAIALPSLQSHVIDVFSDRTMSDDASELNHPIAKANVNPLPSAVAELEVEDQIGV